jgi:hypothetical protein
VLAFGPVKLVGCIHQVCEKLVVLLEAEPLHLTLDSGPERACWNALRGEVHGVVPFLACLPVCLPHGLYCVGLRCLLGLRRRRSCIPTSYGLAGSLVCLVRRLVLCPFRLPFIGCFPEVRPRWPRANQPVAKGICLPRLEHSVPRCHQDAVPAMPQGILDLRRGPILILGRIEADQHPPELVPWLRCEINFHTGTYTPGSR